MTLSISQTLNSLFLERHTIHKTENQDIFFFFQVCSCPPGYEGDPYTGCTQVVLKEIPFIV